MMIDDIFIEDEKVALVGELNVVILSRSGPLSLNRFSPIGRSICFYGEHGWNELNFCKLFIQPSDIIFDVGAHQGTHTIVFADAVGPSGAVHAFEPQRLMFQNICATAALNSKVNIHAQNVAVGDAKGKVRIVDFDYGKRGHFSGMKIAPGNTGAEVDLITIDDYVEERDIATINFLKIDVEGLEAKVLAGARASIDRFKPVLYCEYHDSRNDIRRMVADMGYEMFKHAPAGYNADNYFKYPSDRFQGGQDHNAICIHSDHMPKYEPILTANQSVIQKI